MTPDVSVVIPTFNRARHLPAMLESVLDQDTHGFSFEVIVVDNNSTDNTAAVVSSLQAPTGPRLLYVKEPQQGTFHARNAGIRHANAPIIAFTDDDVRVAPDWLQRIVETFRADPSLAFLGGPVLPLWDGRPPSWLTKENWSPLAVLDYGPTSFQIGASDERGLITANFSIRRDAFTRVGLFKTSLQLVKDTPGSMEDHEMVTRLSEAGELGRYVPSVITYTTIPTERLTKRYHRRWHMGHGRRYAILREGSFERSRMTLLGVPSHVYREVLGGAWGWLSGRVRGASDHSFAQELRFWFAVGFIGERISIRKPVRDDEGREYRSAASPD